MATLKEIELEHRVRELEEENYKLKSISRVSGQTLELYNEDIALEVKHPPQHDLKLAASVGFEDKGSPGLDIYAWGLDNQGNKLSLNNYVETRVFYAEDIPYLLDSMMQRFQGELYNYIKRYYASATERC